MPGRGSDLQASSPLPRQRFILMQRGQSIPSNFALGSISNFKKYGFEDVTVSYSTLKATVKTQNMASFFVLAVHGGDDSGLGFSSLSVDANDSLRRTDEVFFPLANPNSPTSTSNLFGVSEAPPNLTHLKTLILPTCNVFDAWDYNNVRAGRRRSRRSANDPLTMRTSPGLDWWRGTRYATDGTGPILLGYNFPLQQINEERVLKSYRSELERLRGTVSESVLQQYAWLSANAQIPYREVDGAPRNACAWDAKNYYYISYSDPAAPVDPLNQPYQFISIPLERLPGFSASPSGPLALPMTSALDPNTGFPKGAKLVTIP